MFRVYFNYTNESRDLKRGQWLYAFTEVKDQKACLELATKELTAKYKWFEITKITPHHNLLK